jgi:hypothetical protein
MDVLHLTEEQRAKFIHLPIKQAIYVPSTQDISDQVSDEVLLNRVGQVSDFLSKLFGGYSAYDLKGGFIAHASSKEHFIKERFVRVVSFARREAFMENQQKLLQQISRWASEWGQESMGYEYEEDLYYIPK